MAHLSMELVEHVFFGSRCFNKFGTMWLTSFGDSLSKEARLALGSLSQ